MSIFQIYGGMLAVNRIRGRFSEQSPEGHQIGQEPKKRMCHLNLSAIRKVCDLEFD